ncbi:uncharacterized protein LOC124533355 [Vanessa cardui]|uniref:uncharacterized protein LOC124533355 n=1 Tax=Vanessa cardui TaxID=171605 RepID=UPI001F13D09A|nr:uncharacterized protein LOC124533355 [Vanessa cardui]
MTNEEMKCEAYFDSTHIKREDGHYQVRLPFITQPPNLGDSLTTALKSFSILEKRFDRQPKLKERYTEFMADYLDQNHMELVPHDDNSEQVYYLPHHAVINEQHTTTKLRVVFNGSAKTSNGKSLNDNLLIGPPLQSDIRNVTLRWRCHAIVFLGDIRQMYRQIWIDQQDVNYQRILWRPTVDNPIQHYRLTTVTYGTSCAPYLAIKTLKQVAQDENSNYRPEVIKAIMNDFYVDDLLTGATDIEAAIALKEDIIKVLKKGGFTLHKITSNHPKIESTTINTRQILGIWFNSISDKFELKIDLKHKGDKITKRSALCDIAQIYDPSGWLAPIVVKAKNMLQQLWINKLDWDDIIPQPLNQEWVKFRQELKEMPMIELDRWIGMSDKILKVELHGFSDASDIAYSAVIYSRIITSTNIKITMIESKTRVAPVKKISIPRLELCGAVLLAKLIKRVKATLNIDSNNVYAWTDATIVLAWLQKPPRHWSTFVANRVTEIINVIEKEKWNHVVSHENPADVASRGISPLDLPNHYLWWNGPSWLHSDKNFIKQQVDIPVTDRHSPKLASQLMGNLPKERVTQQRPFSISGVDFAGASKELKKMFEQSMINLSPEIAELLAKDSTEWKFNPPGAPHMGGLWEATVKSMIDFHRLSGYWVV